MSKIKYPIRPFMQSDIRHGDRVTILVPSGLGRNGQEYKEKTGTAVMHSAHGGWVLNMGGKYGTPAIADETNTVAVKRIYGTARMK